MCFFFFFQAEDGIRDIGVTGVQTCALPISVLLIIGIVWTIVADRAGRPGVKSTFGLLRAFLIAWSDNRVDMIEELIESRARDNVITTKVIRFLSADSQAAIVLPEIGRASCRERV